MKVLTIKEPFATLIMNKVKYIETRSWKTNYRGELYIQAGISKISSDVKKRQELSNLYDQDDLNYGYIICKCNLIDCVYMTEDFIEKEKKENYNNFVCGHYEVGRYAWVLDNIEVLENPIKVKGQLGIWNYYTIDDILKIMSQIKEGYIDKNNRVHSIYELDIDDYILQKPNDVLKNKVGVCFDQVELERFLLSNNNYQVKTFFIVYKGDNYPTHTFLTYIDDNYCYWLENSWTKFKGIHRYSSLQQLIIDVKNKFIQDELTLCSNLDNLYVYEYSKPKYHISLNDFYNHCLSGVECKEK